MDVGGMPLRVNRFEMSRACCPPTGIRTACAPLAAAVKFLTVVLRFEVLGSKLWFATILKPLRGALALNDPLTAMP